MITLSETILQSKSWQQQLADSITDPKELLQQLDLPLSLLPAAENAARLFPLRVTQDFLKLIKKSDPDDPLLLQILPLQDELDSPAGYLDDPVGDQQATLTPGLIHKYHSRVLLITTPACAVHCRYCFRRHYPYQTASAHGQQLEQALVAIQKDTGISEIILSGGDPFSLSDQVLGKLLDKISTIPHIRTIRFHTRLPAVLPDRITHDLIQLLNRQNRQLVIVLHINHPAELSEKTARAMQALHDAGITLLNQSVLLKGVNNKAEILIQLAQKLFTQHILPYYLHLLDPVKGASHFDIPEKEAIILVKKMKTALPGYLVPKLAREIKNLPYKQNII